MKESNENQNWYAMWKLKDKYFETKRKIFWLYFVQSFKCISLLLFITIIYCKRFWKLEKCVWISVNSYLEMCCESHSKQSLSYEKSIINISQKFSIIKANKSFLTLTTSPFIDKKHWDSYKNNPKQSETTVTEGLNICMKFNTN